MLGRISKFCDHDSGHVPWQSRDYADPVACRATGCPANDKAGHCGSPALALMNAEGQCETFLAFKLKPPVQAAPRCKRCGGRLVNVGGKWEHDGENMGHEVSL